MRSRILFNESLLHRVAEFECGGEPWEIEVANWIRLPAAAEDGALYWLSRGTSVWLYEAGDGKLLGYAALGATNWTLKNQKTQAKESRPIQIIPAFALQTPFHGQPADVPKELRYSRRILADVIAEAADRWKRLKTSPVLGLWVHQQNTKAIRLYESVGFRRLGGPSPEGHVKMFIDVSTD